MKHIYLFIIVLILFSFCGKDEKARAIPGPKLYDPQPTKEKFIPTYFIRYGSTPSVTHSAEITARFDLAVVSNWAFNLWAEPGLNSWQALRKHNPDMIIAVYQNGPGIYDLDKPIGDGWDWIKANHGFKAGENMWTGPGHKYNYLSNISYPKERLMNLGNPEWQNYWIENTYSGFWDTNFANYDGANAIFSDNTNYNVAWAGNWYEENNPGNPEFKDHPLNYATADGVYDNAKWQVDMKAFFNNAVPKLLSKPNPIKLIPNFGYMGQNPEQWTALDNMENPPFAAMEEGAFSQPWSKTYNIYNWESKLNSIKNLKNVAALINNIGKVPGGEGIAKMDIVMSDGNYGPSNGWEVLWYSMTSFLLALNEEKTNAYFGFGIWGYGSYYWLDEYDPVFLHLGKPLGDFYIPDSGPAKDIAFREYEDGWVVTNKALAPAKINVPVPSGKAWVVTHTNLKNPYDTLVTTFNIGKNRGLILLKEGKKIGNEDNFAPDITELILAPKDEAFIVFPNPAADQIEINFMNSYLGSINLYNLKGQLVLSQKGNGKVNIIDTSALNRGLHLIKIQIGEENFLHKVMLM